MPNGTVSLERIDSALQDFDTTHLFKLEPFDDLLPVNGRTVEEWIRYRTKCFYNGVMPRSTHDPFLLGEGISHQIEAEGMWRPKAKQTSHTLYSRVVLKAAHSIRRFYASNVLLDYS